jgi:hypothetical protein
MLKLQDKNQPTAPGSGVLPTQKMPGVVGCATLKASFCVPLRQWLRGAVMVGYAAARLTHPTDRDLY